MSLICGNEIVMLGDNGHEVTFACQLDVSHYGFHQQYDTYGSIKWCLLWNNAKESIINDVVMVVEDDNS